MLMLSRLQKSQGMGGQDRTDFVPGFGAQQGLSRQGKCSSSARDVLMWSWALPSER